MSRATTSEPVRVFRVELEAEALAVERRQIDGLREARRGRGVRGDLVVRLVRRLGRAKLLREIVVATSVASVDDAVVAECARLQVPCFRGSEDDVLDRYYRTAQGWPSDEVVRITADCPLIDAEVVVHTIEVFLNSGADYSSNSEETYPLGISAEVFSSSALEQAWHYARKDYEREHVTPFFY